MVHAYSKDTYDEEEENLEEMPVSVVRDLEKYEFSCSEGIHCL